MKEEVLLDEKVIKYIFFIYYFQSLFTFFRLWKMSVATPLRKHQHQQMHGEMLAILAKHRVEYTIVSRIQEG